MRLYDADARVITPLMKPIDNRKNENGEVADKPGVAAECHAARNDEVAAQQNSEVAILATNVIVE